MAARGRWWRASIVETNTRSLISDRSTARDAFCVRYINTAIKWHRVFGISGRAGWLLITNADAGAGVISGHVLQPDYRCWQTTRFLLDFRGTRARVRRRSVSNLIRSCACASWPVMQRYGELGGFVAMDEARARYGCTCDDVHLAIHDCNETGG